jgi:hypothetical protein
MPVNHWNTISKENIEAARKKLLEQGYSTQEILDAAKNNPKMLAGLHAYGEDATHGDNQLNTKKNTSLYVTIGAGVGLVTVAICYACLYGYAYYEESDDLIIKKNTDREKNKEHKLAEGEKSADKNQKKIEPIQEEVDNTKQAITEKSQKNQKDRQENIAQNKIEEEFKQKLKEEDEARIRNEEARLKKEEIEREKKEREKRLKQEYENPYSNQKYDYEPNYQGHNDYDEQDTCTIS